MAGLVAGLAVLCAITFAALQRAPAMLWLGAALLIGVGESLALRDARLSTLDILAVAVTIPASYVCVGEAVRLAYGMDRSGKGYFAGAGVLVLASAVLLQVERVAPVLQTAPSQLAAAIALVRMTLAVRRRGAARHPVDTPLFIALTCVTVVHLARIPVFPILIGRETPFASLSHMALQASLVTAFSVLVPIVVFLVIARVVANALASHRLEAERDYMTGLPNRRAFEDYAAANRQRGGALVLCDIDKFKTINDRFGHPAGDAVIRAFADLFDGPEMPARIGGEEFAVWMPGATISRARAFAETMRSEIATLRLVEVVGDHRITASFGIAPFAAGCEVDAVMAEADGALYAAKVAGRDRVCIAGERIASGRRDTLAA
ncbi:GGDEF domain-containing protein [Aurantiacibacter spongiae]|uniref:diguanylate cyclase n=1 Tax=Aurantiacibacter spongiae TaxID=2488860 RepID=A0A3N5DHL1_9SPHN|nr:GGDEF domain-containing protein [Aurantiacibacter spongiae]RPF71152.1 GGDEF domain-containing protein [Aurantiacibacter spongiae]